ncbi:MAG TPA: tRNA uridine-5-carboxymethylaminomethyl(34) synthesis enzyme MnmG [Thermomicrobiales bacterium]|nr:tRNA uridine-5-carboxymethylaminomethyl(34) synthesis enzyme MnmG [Thermomicrobiales bacterium]
MTHASLYRTSTTYDIIVIGAGHAGCEAALAAARIGATVLVLTPNLDRVGFMPCNPSIGGPAKGHIVREIDALGGAMARVIDRTAIQIRKLNASKGPAVQALRAQADKSLYSIAMKETLELQPCVELRQESASCVNALAQGGSPRVTSVTTDHGNVYRCGAVVITAGTFLRGSMIAGGWKVDGGRAGDEATTGLALSIGDVGIRLRRLKTGTPPRVDARSIAFDATDVQPGSDEPLWFSFDGRHGAIERLELPPLSIYPGKTDGWRRQMPCYQVHTSPETHQIIVDNVDRSPMFNGTIQGVGPRYCPSIEDKVMRFRNKDSHGLFLEPEGWRTTEVYVQGANTSLPHDVQQAFLRTIPALRDARVTRFGYAVEYDAIEPTELTPWFASKRVAGLFLAGQVNGTSGYEEAAGQGLMAGANAARYVAGQSPLTLRRDQGYIGVMADDLTTQEFVEPYRMLTSRAEHRLMLRSDNADDRLCDIAFDAGLIDADRARFVKQRREAQERLFDALRTTFLTPNDATAELFTRRLLPHVTRSMTAFDYTRRPDVSLGSLISAMSEGQPGFRPFSALDHETLEHAEIEVRYQSYVEKERQHISRVATMEHVPIPSAFKYDAVPGFRNEAREKLAHVRPSTVGQATRIPGVTPSDIAVLLVHLRRQAERRLDAENPTQRRGASDHVAS